jgi:hypothetical protein
VEGPRKLGERCFTLARQLQSGAITPDAAGEALNDVAGAHMALLAQMQHVLDLLIEHQATRARHALAAIMIAGDDSR